MNPLSYTDKNEFMKELFEFLKKRRVPNLKIP